MRASVLWSAFNEGWWFSWLECWPVTPEVAGSSPVHPAIEEAANPHRVAAFLYLHGRDENPRSGVRPSSIRKMGSFAKQRPRRGETSEAGEYNPVHPAVKKHALPVDSQTLAHTICLSNFTCQMAIGSYGNFAAIFRLLVST